MEVLLLSQGLPLSEIRALPMAHRIALYDLMMSGMTGPVGHAIQSVQMMDVLQDIANLWRKDPIEKLTAESLQPMLAKMARNLSSNESTDETTALKEFFSG